MNSKILFTMDIDWTSEDVIHSALSFFKERQIPCLLFQTHFSETIEKEKSSLFSRELHPNFCENSEHGEEVGDVFRAIEYLDHLGVCVRAHKYFMPDEALEYIKSAGYLFTLNNYTNLSYRKPFKICEGVIELNTFFEDGFYLKNNYPFDVNFVTEKIKKEGIYVFNIHPIHLAFNAREYALTRQFKDTLSRYQYRNINQLFINKYMNKEYGIRNFITDLIQKLKSLDCHFISINEIDV